MILRQPVFVASVANNVVGSVAMMFVMTAAPLAAVACGHTIDDGANIIQWHLVGMFAPSFITGTLIKAWFRIRPFWVTQGARKPPALRGPDFDWKGVRCGRRRAAPGQTRWG